MDNSGAFLNYILIGIKLVYLYLADQSKARHTSPGKCGPYSHPTPYFPLASFLSNWDKMTTCENEIINGGKGLLPIISVKKKLSSPSTSCCAKKNRKKLKSLFCEKDRYAQYLSYATFRSYVALLGAVQSQLPWRGIFKQFHNFWLFWGQSWSFLAKNPTKYPFTVTDFAQPPIMLHSFWRWHMKDIEHIYLFHKINFSHFWYLFSVTWGRG